jgi:hypothetical protein
VRAGAAAALKVTPDGLYVESSSGKCKSYGWAQVWGWPLNCDVLPSISRTLRVSSGNDLRPPLTLSLRKHSGQKPRARQRAWPGYRAIPCTVRAVTGQIPRAVGHRHRVRPQTTGKKRRSRPDAPRDAPERPSTANNRRQQQPANMKLAQALNPRATHGNTLVMRSSLGDDEDQGAEVKAVVGDFN